MESNFIGTMLLTMMAVNVFLGMASFSMGSMDSNSAYFDFQHTPAGNMTSTGNINSSFTANYEDASVDVANSVDVSSSTTYTDSFKSTKSWWDKMNVAFGVAFSILRQPAGFMKDIGFPAVIYVSFSAIWYAVGLIALIYLLTGRN